MLIENFFFFEIYVFSVFSQRVAWPVSVKLSFFQTQRLSNSVCQTHSFSQKESQDDQGTLKQLVVFSTSSSILSLVLLAFLRLFPGLPVNPSHFLMLDSALTTKYQVIAFAIGNSAVALIQSIPRVSYRTLDPCAFFFLCLRKGHGPRPLPRLLHHSIVHCPGCC